MIKKIKRNIPQKIKNFKYILKGINTYLPKKAV